MVHHSDARNEYTMKPATNVCWFDTNFGNIHKANVCWDQLFTLSACYKM